MKFAEIIREAGFSPADFPKAAGTNIIFYDGKDRIVLKEHIRFVKELFAENPRSKKQFHRFLEKFEEAPTDLKIRVDEFSVCVLYKTAHAQTFSRGIFTDPLDIA